MSGIELVPRPARRRAAPKRPAPRRGQSLVGSLMVMLLFMIVGLALVDWGHFDTTQTIAYHRSNSAMDLANAGVNRASWMLQADRTAWEAALQGAAPAGYRFDRVYTDVASGTYAVALSSEAPDSVVVMAVGRSPSRRQRRAIRAVYALKEGGGLGERALSAGGVSITGSNFSVEWGAVASGQDLVTGGRAHPQFWSGEGIDLDANGAALPNCDPDCVQWHSHDPDTGEVPNVDLESYRSSAQASGTYFSTSQSWQSLSLTGGKVYYIDGELVVNSPGVYVEGSLIVTGDLHFPNGAWGTGAATMSLPRRAWRQYARDWDYYRLSFDPTAPLLFPGLAAGYESSPLLTKTAGSVFLKGFLYVGGNVTCGGGGGGSVIYGAALVRGSASFGGNSPIVIYLNPDVAKSVRLTPGVHGLGSIVRTRWTEVQLPWPAGLP